MVQKSPLMDGAGYCKTIERMYVKIYDNSY